MLAGNERGWRVRGGGGGMRVGKSNFENCDGERVA